MNRDIKHHSLNASASFKRRGCLIICFVAGFLLWGCTMEACGQTQQTPNTPSSVQNTPNNTTSEKNKQKIAAEKQAQRDRQRRYAEIAGTM